MTGPTAPPRGTTDGRPDHSRGAAAAPESGSHTLDIRTAARLTPAFPDRAPWGTAGKLRAWQEEALEAYFAHEPRDFLAAATPGAGKTTFALRLAAELIARKTIESIVVVAPTEHLKRQWADAAARAGIRLDPGFRNADRRYGRHYRGIAVTYAQVAAKPAVHRDLTEDRRTLVILDEVHHGGDALSWGDAIREAFSRATRRLSLTGTPFRSDAAPIPFVTYLPDEDGVPTSRTDYHYGYGRALRDGVVRPVLFLLYAGQARWRTADGEEMEASLGEGNTKDITAQAWRTALDPAGGWIDAVLASADRRLGLVRQQIPDAGGLVIATDREDARAYARILRRLTGEEAVIVLSDEKEASRRIAAFAEGTARWMVAVRMVSEGVDVPRLSVGVYATSAATPLFFAQAVGRFVRARRRGETASLFLPQVPALVALARELERERDHALGRSAADADPGDLLDAANRVENASAALEEREGGFQPVDSEANFDAVLFDGDEFGQSADPRSDEELEFLGLPGVLEPEQVREVLAARARRQAKRAAARPPGQSPAVVPLYRTLQEQRRLLNSLVGLYAKTTGAPHGVVHADLRRSCGGPAVGRASVSQLQARIDLVRSRLGLRPR